MTDFNYIEGLKKLFNPPTNSDSSDEEADLQKTSDTPSKNLQQKGKSPYQKLDVPEKPTNEILDLEDEVILPNDGASSSWKTTPKWDISYRQSVTASDVFLQMGCKTPATASCEDMVVTVQLPGQKMQNIDIKFRKDNLQVISPDFDLDLPLPQPIHPQKGHAKWDSDREVLIITLKMDREFDLVNF